MIKKFSTLLLVWCLFFSFSSEAGRVPSVKSAQKIIVSYFKSYGKKYPDTDFARSNIDQIQINGVQEIHFQKALVDTFMNLNNNKILRVLVTLETRFPTGWRVTSWEVLGVAQK